MTQATTEVSSGVDSGVWRFGTFRLDVGNARLTEGDRVLELTPKAFDVLCHLVARSGQLVTKDHLLDAVWGGRFVGESVLKSTINIVRGALDDDARAPRFVETVARRGYRFVGMADPVVPLAAPARGSVQPQTRNDSPARQAPLIGRDRLIDALQASLEAARRGLRQMVLVGGPAGIGKSSLVRCLADGAEAGGEIVAIGHCVEQSGGGEPYLPVLDALAELARGPDAALWLANLRRAAPTWLAQLPWLAAGTDQAQLRQELANAAQERMLREFGALLDLATEARPLLLVIEDLHWSDHGTVSLLDYLARRRGPARWMVVATYRQADANSGDHPMHAMRQELRAHKLCRELVLAPFDDSEVDAYLQQRLGGQALRHRRELARALHDHTGGLPLFLARVIDDLVGDGTTISDDDRLWTDPTAALARLQLPQTVVSSIERQMQRLGDDLRGLLEAASVIGLEFDHLLLAEVLGRHPDAVRADCEELGRRGDWLREAGVVAFAEGAIAGRYAFAHALYRRVFYERSAFARRLQLHLQTARQLQARISGRGESAAAEIAHHLEQARDMAQASGIHLDAAARDASAWRVRAARAAVAVHARADALAHYALADLGVLERDERILVRMDRAALCMQLGDGTDALALNEAALDEARLAGSIAPVQDTPLQDAPIHGTLLQDALLQRAQLLHRYDRHEDAIACVDTLLATTPSPEVMSGGLAAKADALDSLGRLEEANAAADEAMACLPADADAARARYLAGRVAAHYHRGEFGPGLAIIDDALALYERVGDAVSAALMVRRRGTFLMLMGQPEEAEPALLDAYARSQALDDVEGQRGAVLNLVKIRTDRGDAAGSLALLDTGWRLSPRFESPVAECAFLSGFYYCDYLLGDLGAAWRDAARVLNSAESLNSVAWRAGSLVLVCALHIHFGKLDRARALIDEAEAQSAGMHHIGVQARTHGAWLDVLTGHADHALVVLDAMGDDALVQPEDLAVIARVRAQALLALDRPAEALAVLAGRDGAPTQEVWVLMLALRLRAQIAIGDVVAADVERARLELADSRVPAVESTVLRASLAAALEHVGQGDAAAAERSLLAAQRERLAASLDDNDELKQAYRATWTDAPTAPSKHDRNETLR